MPWHLHEVQPFRWPSCQQTSNDAARWVVWGWTGKIQFGCLVWGLLVGFFCNGNMIEIWYWILKKTCLLLSNILVCLFYFSFNRSKQGIIIFSFSQHFLLPQHQAVTCIKLPCRGENLLLLSAIFFFSFFILMPQKLFVNLVAIISSLFEISGAIACSDSIVAVGNSSSGDWKTILLFWNKTLM